MATQQRAARPGRGRPVPARRSGRTLLILGGIMLLALAVLAGALVAAKRPGAEQPAIAVAAQGSVANAELFGRAWGPQDAPIKVEEFIDYQCPACGAYAREIEPQVMAAFAASGKVRYEIHNFPFKGTASQNAAEGAYCAAEQDTFWPMHASIFLNQPQEHSTSNVFGDAQLVAIATRLQMDGGAFQKCLSSNRYAQRVQADYHEATARSITSTPTFVVNGQPFVGIKQVQDFRQIFATVAPDVKVAP
jgi:protein-disulfide isomerase